VYAPTNAVHTILPLAVTYHIYTSWDCPPTSFAFFFLFFSISYFPFCCLISILLFWHLALFARLPSLFLSFYVFILCTNFHTP
jgi:hypothetical protein